MSEEMLIELMEFFIRTTILVSAPLVAAIMVSGLLLNVVQTVTQLKDQSITLVPKFLIVAVVFIFTVPWYIQLTHQFTERIMALMEIAAK